VRRRIAGSRASTKSIHKPARSLRRSASLLSTFSPLAGVTAKTSFQVTRRAVCSPTGMHGLNVAYSVAGLAVLCSPQLL